VRTVTARDRRIWDGVYHSFAEANGDSSVFTEDVWLGKVTERARRALDASRGGTSIAALAETRDYALPVVAAMTARRTATLRVLDFGGGLATSFVPLVQMLPEGQLLEFVIVENEKICSRGRDLFEGDGRVCFQSELPVQGSRFDIVHCGSSLHYVDDWQGIVRKLVDYNPECLIFADLPAADNASFVTTQSFYGKRIPVHFWNLDQFTAVVANLGYAMAFKARYRAPVLEVDLNTALSHFGEAYRLDYFVQLIFRPTSRP
jgi:putative methyltransferase (TIGR04325 family)